MVRMYNIVVDRSLFHYCFASLGTTLIYKSPNLLYTNLAFPFRPRKTIESLRHQVFITQ